MEAIGFGLVRGIAERNVANYRLFVKLISELFSQRITTFGCLKMDHSTVILSLLVHHRDIRAVAHDCRRLHVHCVTLFALLVREARHGLRGVHRVHVMFHVVGEFLHVGHGHFLRDILVDNADQTIAGWERFAHDVAGRVVQLNVVRVPLGQNFLNLGEKFLFDCCSIDRL